ncbi:MAG: hypothetical protein KAU20_04950 [Nanoarchaeota archaeon]|nr:hypothetical protein [Nanoarchaeota archaeon]
MKYEWEYRGNFGGESIYQHLQTGDIAVEKENRYLVAPLDKLVEKEIFKKIIPIKREIRENQKIYI